MASTTKNRSTDDYSASSIETLEGPEAVRKRHEAIYYEPGKDETPSEEPPSEDENDDQNDGGEA